jgi:hypothetical protein
MRYLITLELCGGERIELDPRSRWDREQQWRHVYSARLHAATGQWKWQDYDWHVFSYQHVNARRADKAVAEYVQLEAPVLSVIPEKHAFPACPCSSSPRRKSGIFRDRAWT